MKLMDNFKKEVEAIINKLGIDNYFNIPDFILADYLANQLEVLDVMKQKKCIFNNIKKIEGEE